MAPRPPLETPCPWHLLSNLYCWAKSDWNQYLYDISERRLDNHQLSQTMRAFTGLDPSPQATISSWDTGVRIHTGLAADRSCLSVSLSTPQLHALLVLVFGRNWLVTFSVILVGVILVSAESRILLSAWRSVSAENEITTYGRYSINERLWQNIFYRQQSSPQLNKVGCFGCVLYLSTRNAWQSLAYSPLGTP